MCLVRSEFLHACFLGNLPVFLTHGGGDRKAHDPAHGDDHVGLGIEVFEQGADFVFSWSTVTLQGSADQAKAGEGGTSKANALSIHVDAVNGGRMGQDRVETREIDRQGCTQRSNGVQTRAISSISVRAVHELILLKCIIKY